MKSDRSSTTIIAAVLVVVVVTVILSVMGQGWSSAPIDRKEAASATPIALPAGGADRLDRPRLSEPPTQVEQGNLVYWSICMSCHGDRGQGLTEEWRFLAYPQDKDCWTSQCHSDSHPPQSFELPRNVPALSGDGMLNKFISAKQLHDYVLSAMPWWNPGSLSPDQSWQVTAYLLNINGALPAGMILDGTVASAIPIHRTMDLPVNDRLFALFLAVMMSLAVLGIVLREAAPAEQSIPGSTDILKPPLRRGIHRPSFVAHIHPPTIPVAQARWRYTLGAGGIAVFLCLVLLVTGLLEMFYYVPSSTHAPVSIETIHFFVPFGSIVRNLHYWAAQMLVVVSAVHLLRVVLTGAYAAPRRFNYLLGMALFAFVLILDFTGYVLRWDEGIRWALITGTNLLNTIPLVGQNVYHFVVGGSRVGPATLVRFYAWHSFALVTPAAFLLIWHIFRIRRDGGISAPSKTISKSLNSDVMPVDSPSSRQTAPARIPRSLLIKRELLGVYLVSILLILVSTFVPAPLGTPIQDIPAVNGDSQAPWFFLWIQQMLKFGDPFMLGVLIPLLLLVCISGLPYIFPGPAGEELGQWFPPQGRIVQIIVVFLTFVILALTLLALIPSSNV